MITASELFYKEGNLESYKYYFVGKNKERLTEYIHCIVLERLEEFDGYSPRKIRVKQIHNLEAYYTVPDYNDFSERILKTDYLEFLIIRQ